LQEFYRDKEKDWHRGASQITMPNGQGQ